MKINEKILLLRNREHLSQEMLAQQLQVSRQAVSKWEVGDALPDADKMVMLSELFHVSTDWLLKDEYSELPTDNGNISTNTIWIISITGMLLLLFGSYITWRMWQLAIWIYGCFALQVIIFTIGWITMENRKTDKLIIQHFQQLSTWILLPIPSYIIMQAFIVYYPRSYEFYMVYLVWMVVYIILGGAINLLLKRKH